MQMAAGLRMYWNLRGQNVKPLSLERVYRLRACIGSDEKLTVYFGELHRIFRALDGVVEDNSNYIVLTRKDNQAAIISSEQAKQQSAQQSL